MDNIKHLFNQLINRSKQSRQKKAGQGLVEYAIILLFVGLAVVAIVQVMGPTVTNVFNEFVDNAPVAPPSLVNYTPPPTFTPTATEDPNATPTSTPMGPLASVTPTFTHTPEHTPTSTPTNTPEPTVTPTSTNTPVPAACAYGPYSVPGTGTLRVQAENYMCGGQGVAYNDTNNGGSGTCANYRTDENPRGGVDLESSGDDGTCSIGWINAGEWVRYEVDATTTKQHYFTLRVAGAASGRVRIRVTNQFGTFQTSAITLPNTGSWNTWTDYIVQDSLFLDAGSTNTIQIYTERSGYNINYFDIDTSPPATPVPEGILFVVGRTNLSRNDARGDRAVRDRLVSQGYDVIVVDDSASSTADASGKQLVLISSTSNSNSVGAKFRDVNVPVIVWEYALFDDMYLARTRNLDNNERDLRFLSVGEGGLPSHPLASGISGTPGQDIRVTTSNDAFSWGNPGNGADYIAIASREGNNDTDELTIFAYDTGKVMDDSGHNFVAPAKRVAFFFSNVTATRVNGDGWRLFDNAVNWALTP